MTKVQRRQLHGQVELVPEDEIRSDFLPFQVANLGFYYFISQEEIHLLDEMDGNLARKASNGIRTQGLQIRKLTLHRRCPRLETYFLGRLQHIDSALSLVILHVAALVAF